MKNNITDLNKNNVIDMNDLIEFIFNRCLELEYTSVNEEMINLILNLELEFLYSKGLAF